MHWSPACYIYTITRCHKEWVKVFFQYCLPLKHLLLIKIPHSLPWKFCIRNSGRVLLKALHAKKITSSKWLVSSTSYTMIYLIYLSFCLQSLRTYLTTAGDLDSVAAVERLPALQYSVDFIFLPFGIMVVLWNFETIRG